MSSLPPTLERCFEKTLLSEETRTLIKATNQLIGDKDERACWRDIFSVLKKDELMWLCEIEGALKRGANLEVLENYKVCYLIQRYISAEEVFLPPGLLKMIHHAKKILELPAYGEAKAVGGGDGDFLQQLKNGLKQKYNLLRTLSADKPGFWSALQLFDSLKIELPYLTDMLSVDEFSWIAETIRTTYAKNFMDNIVMMQKTLLSSIFGFSSSGPFHVHFFNKGLKRTPNLLDLDSWTEDSLMKYYDAFPDFMGINKLFEQEALALIVHQFINKKNLDEYIESLETPPKKQQILLLEKVRILVKTPTSLQYLNIKEIYVLILRFLMMDWKDYHMSLFLLLDDYFNVTARLKRMSDPVFLLEEHLSPKEYENILMNMDETIFTLLRKRFQELRKRNVADILGSDDFETYNKIMRHIPALTSFFSDEERLWIEHMVAKDVFIRRKNTIYLGSKKGADFLTWLASDSSADYFSEVLSYFEHHSDVDGCFTFAELAVMIPILIGNDDFSDTLRALLKTFFQMKLSDFSSEASLMSYASFQTLKNNVVILLKSNFQNLKNKKRLDNARTILAFYSQLGEEVKDLSNLLTPKEKTWCQRTLQEIDKTEALASIAPPITSADGSIMMTWEDTFSLDDITTFEQKIKVSPPGNLTLLHDCLQHSKGLSQSFCLARILQRFDDISTISWTQANLTRSLKLLPPGYPKLASELAELVSGRKKTKNPARQAHSSPTEIHDTSPTVPASVKKNKKKAAVVIDDSAEFMSRCTQLQEKIPDEVAIYLRSSPKKNKITATSAILQNMMNKVPSSWRVRMMETLMPLVDAEWDKAQAASQTAVSEAGFFNVSQEDLLYKKMLDKWGEWQRCIHRLASAGVRDEITYASKVYDHIHSVLTCLGKTKLTTAFSFDHSCSVKTEPAQLKSDAANFAVKARKFYLAWNQWINAQAVILDPKNPLRTQLLGAYLWKLPEHAEKDVYKIASDLEGLGFKHVTMVGSSLLLEDKKNKDEVSDYDLACEISVEHRHLSGLCLLTLCESILPDYVYQGDKTKQTSPIYVGHKTIYSFQFMPKTAAVQRPLDLTIYLTPRKIEEDLSSAVPLTAAELHCVSGKFYIPHTEASDWLSGKKRTHRFAPDVDLYSMTLASFTSGFAHFLKMITRFEEAIFVRHEIDIPEKEQKMIKALYQSEMCSSFGVYNEKMHDYFLMTRMKIIDKWPSSLLRKIERISQDLKRGAISATSVAEDTRAFCHATGKAGK